MPPKQLVTRFAPSPTGYLHMGHVISMIFVFGVADLLGAQVLLRMEDHDRERCRKEYEQAILDDMAWLGFIPYNWQEFSSKKLSTRYRQSDNPEVYQRALDHLFRKQKTYYCTCSRKQLALGVEGQEPCYPGTCRTKQIAEGQNLGMRLKLSAQTKTFSDLFLGMNTQNPVEQCGDFLLKDRRGFYTYNFSVVVDDINQGVNLIIRGQDLLDCTGRQLLLAEELGHSPSFLYLHHPLICDSMGKKLSKRTLAEGIIYRRQAGESPEKIIGEALHAAGVTAKAFSVKVSELRNILGEYLKL